uniref:Conotoxin ArchIIIA n=1 Tax=Conus archon TaxID=257315 RepID=CM3A_CONAC|nr:RecName: Full=Conotoxin ArchIIIA; AltName: Full=F27-1 [Conus archon]
CCSALCSRYHCLPCC